MSLWRFFHREKWDRERHEEIDSYVEIETDQNVACGMGPKDARDAARKKLGNSTLIREDIYRMNTVVLLDTLGRDVRHGLRTMRHNPGFAAVALLTLAIGIGATTAVFSVVDSVLLKPLPYPKPEELVGISHTAPGASGLASVGEMRVAASMYFTYSEQNKTFQTLGVWVTGAANITGLAEPEQVRTVFTSDGTLQTLNVPPSLGRWLSSADQIPGGPESVMLGHGYWLRRFGGDRSVIGRSITVDSRPREIVGVMPEGFRVVTADFDLLVPLAFDRGQLRLAGFSYQGLGRLKPRIPIEQAKADLQRLVPTWINSWPIAPGTNRHDFETWGITPAVRPLKQDVVGNLGNVLWVLMGTVGIVMLIACANVANLLLVRAEARRQELAVRAALGAGWARLVRELLIESLLLAILGGMVGLGIAYAGLRVLVAIGPANLPRLSEISLDPRALGFTLLLSLLSGVLFGLIPALKYGGPRISPDLRSADRTSSTNRERHRIRNVLVVAQMAMAVVLLVCAGLMIRTFQVLRTVEPGFTHGEQLQILRISIPESLVPEPERVARTQYDIAGKLAAIPSVSSAAFTSAMPMEGIEDNPADRNLPAQNDIRVETRPYLSGETPLIRLYKYISPGLFQTAGTRILAGRDLTWSEFQDRRPVAIVSENLARELWGAPSEALGKRIATGVPAAPWREVIGVIEDVRNDGLNEPARATVYWPSFNEGLFRIGAVRVLRSVTFVVRSDRAGTEGFLRQIHQAVGSVNASLPLASVRTMQDIYSQSLARTSFTLVMLAIAGAMALVLGVVGIYGVIAYAVSQRSREIGIRLALGARPGELQGMFVRHGLTLASVGVVIGLPAAAGLTRLMSSLLFGISPLDPLSYVGGALVLATAAVLASYLPARRASAVDPVEALKAE